MLARRLLLVVLAVAAAVHASAQCLTESQTSTLQAISNSIPSNQPPCFNTLSVVLDGCSIRVTSNENGCGWLQLSGSFTGNPPATVQASGPLSAGASAATLFEFSQRGYYDRIQLNIVGEADTSQASYKVAVGRMLQIRAALNNPVSNVDGTTSTASTSTANCNTGNSLLVRVAVSKNCPWMGQTDCLKTLSVGVSNCVVFLTNGNPSCPRFLGRITSAGTSASLAVNYATNSRSQGAPAAMGRKMLQSSELTNAGRMLKQFDEGTPWGLFVAGQFLGLRQGSCGVFYQVAWGSTLGVN